MRGRAQWVQGVNLTTISTEPKILWEFGRQELKTCSLYHENLFIQKVKVISTQVLNNFFSASDIMEAVRGRFHFYGINYKGCVIQVVLLQNKWVDQLLCNCKQSYGCYVSKVEFLTFYFILLF